MSRKTKYVCQNCATSNAKWLGRCPACGEWNSFVEEKEPDVPSQKPGSLSALRDELSDKSGSDWYPLEPRSDEVPQHLKRMDVGLKELNRVLGGGLVPDSFTLIGGDPGIGKSTLLLQAAHGVARSSGCKVLYVSGEESIDQIRGRAHRLGVESDGKIFLAADTQIEKVLKTVNEVKPQVLVMDSLQTFVSTYLESAPGSVSQLREVAARLMTLAKTKGIAVWLVGHVTKEGSIAGPKVVEHMVDTVLYFEGDGGQNYRLLRAVKNRFGSSRELGVFEMVGEGLREVTNPSSLFLSEREEAVPGTAISASMEGSRPILVELQALLSDSPLAQPRRTSVGMDSARVSLLGAILERHLGLSLAKQDLFFNVAGGLRLSEPACDLGAAAAILSSARNIALPLEWVFIGEVSLTGEVRRVSLPEVRIDEARKLGFKKVFVPKSALERCKKIKDVDLTAISNLSNLMNLF